MSSEKVMDHFQEQPLQQAVWQQSLSKERTFSRH